jgi:hypothetical protein
VHSKPLARYDVKHHKFTSIANGPKASKEELAVDGKQKKQSKPSKKKKKEGSPKAITCCQGRR